MEKLERYMKLLTSEKLNALEFSELSYLHTYIITCMKLRKILDEDIKLKETFQTMGHDYSDVINFSKKLIEKSKELDD